MCDPLTIIAGTTAVVSGYGQYQQGQYQEKVAKNNAIIQQRMADDALSRGQRAENEHRLKVAMLKDKQRTAIAAGGREISGSAFDVLEDTEAMGELDALTIRQNASNEAWGNLVNASNYRAQGKLDRMAGTSGAATTILSGAGSAYRQYQIGKINKAKTEG